MRASAAPCMLCVAEAGYAKWDKANWPSQVYHFEETRQCLRHTAARNAKTSERNAAERRQTPPWADRAATRAVFDEAKRLTLKYGRSYHVDHIIPLRGEMVSGLHVHTNLEAIPHDQNIRKLNHFKTDWG